MFTCEQTEAIDLGVTALDLAATLKTLSMAIKKNKNLKAEYHYLKDRAAYHKERGISLISDATGLPVEELH